MATDLGHGRGLDDAPGVIGVAAHELPALPDDILTNRQAGRIDPRNWFAHPQLPFEIEIGSGKGSFLLDQAAAAPQINFLGIEWEAEFYYYAADRIRRRGLRNVRMLRADAGAFLRWRCPDAIVRVIHLYYSDPWPKTKHHKNRVIQDRFLEEAWRVLVAGGELRIVTDHEDLWAWNEEHFARWTTAARPGRFVREEFHPPQWVTQGHLVGTNYEKKTRAEGRPPRAAVLRKVV